MIARFGFALQGDSPRKAPRTARIASGYVRRILSRQESGNLTAAFQSARRRGRRLNEPVFPVCRPSEARHRVISCSEEYRHELSCERTSSHRSYLSHFAESAADTCFFQNTTYPKPLIRCHPAAKPAIPRRRVP
jgi:hypothetical protein